MSFGTANTRSVVKNFHLILVCLPSMHSKCQQHICTVGMGSVWRAPLWPPRADSGDREVAEAAAGQQGEGGVGRRRLQAVADALAVGGVPLCCPCIRHDVSGRRVSGFFLLAHPTHPPLGNWRESGGTRVWGFTLGQPSSDWAHFPFPPPWACLTGRLTIPTGPPDDDQPPSNIYDCAQKLISQLVPCFTWPHFPNPARAECGAPLGGLSAPPTPAQVRTARDRMQHEHPKLSAQERIEDTQRLFEHLRPGQSPPPNDPRPRVGYRTLAAFFCSRVFVYFIFLPSKTVSVIRSLDAHT